MAGEEFTDLVRFRNDGEDFHINWTTRRALRILGGRDGLVAVAVEGISDRDRYKGRRIAEGLLVADTVEYHDGETLEDASLIVVNQLKYSTQHPDRPWSWSDVEPMMEQFAARYRKIARECGVAMARSKLRFRFVTNRPISKNVLDAIDHLIGKRADPPKGHALTVTTAMPTITKLAGNPLNTFLNLVDLGHREASREAVAARAAKEANDLLPSIARDPVTVLRDTVRRFGTSTHAEDPTIRLETVLQAFGVDDPAKLFPAPSEFEDLKKPVVRRQEPELAEVIRTAATPILVTASGGTGKSIIAQRIAGSLPAGSETVLFDGFAGGRYRVPSERRHRHDVGLVQLANELAGRGLCDVLLPVGGGDRELLVAFRDRLRQAAALVRKRSPDALVAVVLDAADNSVFAARLHHDAPFVSSLLAEPPPEGCRILALARPERVGGLHADSVRVFPLEGFNDEETGNFVRRHDPSADIRDFATFRRLTFGNPRVQANQLALAGTLAAAIDQLGPGGLSVEDVIEGQLEKGLAQVRDAQPEADIDALCTGLAGLPPMVPIRILAQIGGASAEQIASFASDFGGGRPLMLREDALQFRDEPVEKWFIDNFVPDSEAAGRFVDRLAPLALSDAYAALSLPQLMLQAGRHSALMHLALASDPGFADKPVERQAIVLQQVRFGLRSAFELDDMTSVAKLFVRAGEQVATSERQDRFLQDNADLVPLLSGAEVTQDFVHRRWGGSWFGSVNAYKAEMLAVMPETRDEARGFLHLALRWLDEWVRRARAREPDDWTPIEDSIDEDSVAAMLFATCLLEGAQAAAKFAERFTPGDFRFKFTLSCARKMLDAGRTVEVGNLLDRLWSGEARAAVHLAQKQRGAHTGVELVRQTINALTATDLPAGPFGYDDSNFADALLTVAECGAKHGLRDEALELLGRANWSMSSHPLPDVGGRIVRSMRATALTATLSGSVPSIEDLWRRAHRGSSEELPPVRPEFREIHDRLLPTFLLRARVLTGERLDAPAEIEALSQGRSLVGFDRWQEREFRGTRLLAEVELLAWAGVLDEELLQGRERKAAGDKTLWQQECLTLIGMLTPFESLHGELIRLGGVAAETGEDAHDDAEVRTGHLAAIARELMPIMKEESAAFFAKALEEADRVGEELHERLYMLLEMGRSLAGDARAPEHGYRVLRLAEVYAQINSHKFPWHEVFKTLAHMHPPTALAALSRLDSRERVAIPTYLSDLGETLLKAGVIGLGMTAALHAFGGVWRFKDLPALLAALAGPVQAEIGERILRDMVDEKYDAWDMRDAVAAVEAVSPIPPDIAAVFARRRASADRNAGNYTPRPEPVIDHAAIVAGKHLTDPVDVAAAVAEFKAAASYGASLDPLAAAMRGQITVAQRIDHLRTVAKAEVDVEDALALLSQAATAWAPSLAIAQEGRRLAADIIERRPFDLLSYHWKSATGALLQLTELDRPDLLRLLIRGIGTQVDELGSSSLFWLARQVNEDLLEPKDRHEVLAFTLDRFEAIVSADEPDGDWRAALVPSEDVPTSVALLVWTSLGDPSPRRRWRATHVVRRLARHGETETLDAVLGQLSETGCGAFIDQRLPFYAELARTHLLVAIARLADELPNSVISAIPQLRRLADRSQLNVVQRQWAAQALLTLEAAGEFTPDPSEREALLHVLERDASRRPIPTPSAKPKGEEYHFPFDFDRREANPIASAFEVSQIELRARAARAIRERLGREPVQAWVDDPRSSLGVYDHRYREGPEKETLATYEAWQGLFLAVGELLEGDGPTPILVGEESYLLCEHFLSAPPMWQSDLRDPDPTSDWPEPVGGRDNDDWQWRVAATDFENALFDADGGMRIAGDWTRHWSLAREGGSVGSALVRPEFAIDLLRALQTFPGRFPWIPTDGGDIDLRFQKMRVTPWIANDDRADGIDTSDPFAGTRAATFSPGRIVRRILRLRRSNDRRTWQSTEGRPAFHARRTAWGEPPEDRQDERLDHGSTLTVPIEHVVGVLKALERSLIVRVGLKRYSSRGRDEEPSTYAKYFILDGDGRLTWLGGDRRAWQAADAAAG
ncbi:MULTISPECIES: hypothetical protein [unclassified Sphingomonas]|uniref:hypothetical protein n=1 Tax=unclassified Sphingomonas TaxID=196159 RepID=UPI0007003594|nr:MULTISPECIES: hypothetical protein [unclassified Sphingomonas]KQM62615.1 hypothetical protein ASE65_17680 [Sphingomonas sp. Leaf16]KQM88566.1 hypothetical protein ASE67_02135 [Sphingomonas sp. Leaf23]KQN14866.1 hypothetical protein ASE81_17695 [Sphingomonas sp. Leaf29]KQN20399.1 hypothetical protein ASE83_17665 [Sphingomonas sp. Leaf32]